MAKLTPYGSCSAAERRMVSIALGKFVERPENDNILQVHRLKALLNEREILLNRRELDKQATVRQSFPNEWDEKEEVARIKRKFSNWLMSNPKEIDTVQPGDTEDGDQVEGGIEETLGNDQEDQYETYSGGSEAPNEARRSSNVDWHEGSPHESEQVSVHDDAYTTRLYREDSVKTDVSTARESGLFNDQPSMAAAQEARHMSSRHITDAVRLAWFRNNGPVQGTGVHSLIWSHGRGWICQAALSDVGPVKTEPIGHPIKRERQEDESSLAKRVKIKTEIKTEH